MLSGGEGNNNLVYEENSKHFDRIFLLNDYLANDERYYELEYWDTMASLFFHPQSDLPVLKLTLSSKERKDFFLCFAALPQFFHRWATGAHLKKLKFDVNRQSFHSFPNQITMMESKTMEIESRAARGDILIKQRSKVRIYYDNWGMILKMELIIKGHDEYLRFPHSYTSFTIDTNRHMLVFGFPIAVHRFLDLYSIMTMSPFQDAIEMETLVLRPHTYRKIIPASESGKYQ